MKAYTGSRGIDPLILNFAKDKRLGGLQSHSESFGEQKNFCLFRDSNPALSSTILTELYQLPNVFTGYTLTRLKKSGQTSRAAARCANQEGVRRLQWNNRKYGASKLGFLYTK